ncbi:type 1 fimbrial protein [Pseudomonas marginalis]|nr:type 1 fimbrial protein [Pseudomonas marginalis]
MKLKKTAVFGALIVAAGSAFVASTASAADGLINFVGEITDQTCTINGGSGQNFTVTLPRVSSSALVNPGSWAGRTAFNVVLTNCNPLTGPVAVYFEPGAETDTTTGRLNIDGGTGTATNVQVGLLNSDATDIRVGSAQHNSKSSNLVAGGATLNYYAQYYSLGSATAGGVRSRVNYTIVYQ